MVAHLFLWSDYMRKISGWFIALLSSLISLAAMLIFDFILSLAYHYIGKVPFLTEIMEYIGDIMDLGLTTLVAALLATAIWRVGLSVIEKLYGHTIAFDESPIYHINVLFIFVFFAMAIFVGYQFITLIGGAVRSYTSDMQGMGKFLIFFKAIKDVFLYVRSENILFYKIGTNSLILFIISIFVPVK
jgi:hypothetical protein